MKYKRIIILGFRCVGKNYVGRLLSKKLNLKLVNMDSKIEKIEKKTIAEISEKGKDWVKFRDVELSLLKDLLKKENVVISAGGGVGVNDIKHKDSGKTFGKIETELLKNDKDTLKILITADEKNIEKRLIESEKKSQGLRPILDSKLAKSKKEHSLEIIANHNLKMFRSRKKNYENLADLVIENNSNKLDINKVLEAIQNV